VGRPCLNAVALDAVRSASSIVIIVLSDYKRAFIGQSFGVHLNNIGCLATLLLPYIRSTEVPFLSFTYIPMALRTPLTRAARRATSTATATPALSAYSAQWRRGNATVAPVTQSTGPKKGHCYGLHEHGRAVDDRRSWQLSERALRELDQTSSLD